MADQSNQYKPVLLLIWDGFGVAANSPGNAITSAKMPNFEKLISLYPNGILQASGEAVGLLPDDMGSTEVGHLNLGAGRVFLQDLPKINHQIKNGVFLENPAFIGAVNHAIKNNSKLHLMGLVSDGNVHASIEHLYALLWFARNYGLKKEQVMVHAFLDGRDTSPNSGALFIANLNRVLKTVKVGQIATISGRYFAMDRDNRWDRTEKAYNAIVSAEGPTATSAYEAINEYYKSGTTDEFIPPTILLNDQKQPIGTLDDNDSVIFFNFRTDRARQLTKAIVLDQFETLKVGDRTIKTFNRQKHPKNIYFSTMTEYEPNLPVSAVAFPQEHVELPVAEVISEHGLKQLHVAESEKQRMVTIYFNGLKTEPFKNEDWQIIPSPSVPTYDLKPEMSSPEISEYIIEQIQTKKYDFIVANFASADMVGHTGKLTETIEACEALDACLGDLVEAIMQAGGVLLLTADHGNAEQMLDAKGMPNTNHSKNPVPLLIVAEGLKYQVLPDGKLADVAPTILKLLNIPQPAEMTGSNLLN